MTTESAVRAALRGRPSMTWILRKRRNVGPQRRPELRCRLL